MMEFTWSSYQLVDFIDTFSLAREARSFYWGWVEKLPEDTGPLREWGQPLGLVVIPESSGGVTCVTHLCHICLFGQAPSSSPRISGYTLSASVCSKTCVFFRSDDLMGRRMHSVVMEGKYNVEGQISALPELFIPPPACSKPAYDAKTCLCGSHSPHTTTN